MNMFQRFHKNNKLADYKHIKQNAETETKTYLRFHFDCFNLTYNVKRYEMRCTGYLQKKICEEHLSNKTATSYSTHSI